MSSQLAVGIYFLFLTLLRLEFSLLGHFLLTGTFFTASPTVNVDMYGGGAVMPRPPSTNIQQKIYLLTAGVQNCFVQS